jgi:hypothetical protein
MTYIMPEGDVGTVIAQVEGVVERLRGKKH